MDKIYIIRYTLLIILIPVLYFRLVIKILEIVKETCNWYKKKQKKSKGGGTLFFRSGYKYLVEYGISKLVWPYLCDFGIVLCE